jgi:hypothetical protein
VKNKKPKMKTKRLHTLPFIEKHKTMAKRAVAKLLLEEFPNDFSDIESARTFIRKLTGNQGTSHTSGKIRILDTFGKLPEEVTDIPSEPYYLPKSVRRLGLLFDVHGLFHDSDAYILALKWLINNGCDCIFLGGDFVDFYSISKFQSLPNKSHFQNERAWAIEALQQLQELFPQVYYKKGNHENRYEHYMLRNAPLIFNESEHNIDTLFGFKDSRIKYIHESQLTIVGKLGLLHGHEIRGGGVVNIARNKMLKFFDNLAFGHHHKRNEELIKNGMTDEYFGAYSVGCLCKTKVGYYPFNQWNHGFGFVELDKDGLFSFHNKIIIRGKVL